MTDNLTKMIVVLSLVECNEKILEATSGFVNPDNLLDLPEELLDAFRDVLRTTTNLADLFTAHLEKAGK